MALDLSDSSWADGIVMSNMKALADAPLLNAQAHQNRLNILAETALSRAIEAQHGTSVLEGLGVAAAAAANPAQRTSDLGGAIAAIQQLMKGAQTTPPPTSG